MSLRFSRGSLELRDQLLAQPRADGAIHADLWTGANHAWDRWEFNPALEWVLWRRWWWALRSWIYKQKFRCRVCDTSCPIAPLDSGFWRSTAICSACCPEHDYEYFRDLGMWACTHCNGDAPDDLYCD